MVELFNLKDITPGSDTIPHIMYRQEKMRDREGEQGRWPGYVNFTKVIFRSHQTEVCFPRGPPVLGMTSYELIGALRYGIV